MSESDDKRVFTVADERRARELELAAMFAQRSKNAASAYGCALFAAKMLRIGASLRRLAVKELNEPVTERDRRRAKALAADAVTIAGLFGCNALVGGDPRGPVLHLTGADVPSNGFSDGFGIG